MLYLPLGVYLEIEKNTKIQKMDWGKRPLSEEELKYAADDVFHLIELRNLFVKNLKKLNRLSWTNEEIVRLTKVRFGENGSMEDSFLRIKGVRVLRPHQLAVLRELSIFREKLALKKNAPPYKIIGNKTLITLAINPETNVDSMKGIGRWLLNQARKDLTAALQRGINAEPVFLPKIDSLIVGSYFKKEGKAANQVEEKRVIEFMKMKNK